MRTCSQNNCDRRHHGRGLCSYHYQLAYRKGTPYSAAGDDLPGEEWRQCPIFPRFEVSDMGRVRNASTLRVLHQFLNRKGYPEINYVISQTAHRHIAVHRLVMLTFVGSLPEGHGVDHINCDKTDNRLVNLEYVTTGENSRRWHRHRRALLGRTEVGA